MLVSVLFGLEVIDVGEKTEVTTGEVIEEVTVVTAVDVEAADAFFFCPLV